MKTVQMTLDDQLVLEVDKVVKKLKTSRSAFARKALQFAVSDFYVKQLEEKQIKGYQKHPVHSDEFIELEEESWID